MQVILDSNEIQQAIANYAKEIGLPVKDKTIEVELYENTACITLIPNHEPKTATKPKKPKAEKTAPVEEQPTEEVNTTNPLEDIVDTQEEPTESEQEQQDTSTEETTSSNGIPSGSIFGNKFNKK